MSKKQNVRKVQRKSLPYGRFNYIIQINRSHWRTRRSRPNGNIVEEMRPILSTTCKERYRLDWVGNYRGRRVYTHLFLINPMDVALIKMMFPHHIRKIYQVEINPDL